MTFEDWRRSVDAVMIRNYCIDCADAGWADFDLRRFWAGGEEAEEFVEWFAEKYALTPRTEWEWGGQRRG